VDEDWLANDDHRWSADARSSYDKIIFGSKFGRIIFPNLYVGGVLQRHRSGQRLGSS
jgi:hypothetical protein